MSKCQCERCQPDSPSKTFSESFRVECEARLILTWTLAQRQAYLKHPAVQGRRKELEAELMRQWMARKAG